MDELNELDAQKNKYVTFQSGNEYFGLSIDYVSEIVVFQDVTEIPESPDYVKGLINLRGKIIPVVDVRLRFNQEEIPYTDRTCIIVVQYEGMTVGLIVEKIAEVVELTPDRILPAPTLAQGDKSQDRFVCGIGKVGDEVKLLLDPARLLKDGDAKALAHLDSESDDDEGEGEN